MIKFTEDTPPKSAPPKTKQTVYDNFTGADFSNDAYLCRTDKSPDILNMIGEDGILTGRTGWEPVYTAEGVVNGLCKGFAERDVVYLAHIGTKLYSFKPDGTELSELYSGLPNEKSVLFFATRTKRPLVATEDLEEPKNLGFVLTGAGFFYVDFYETPVQVGRVSDIATVPVVKIGVKPNGAGETLDAVNLLQKKRSEKFLGDGSSKTFQLGAKDLDSDLLEIVEITASGQKTYTENSSGATGFSVNRALGSVTFVTAPPTPPVTGEENIYITYAKTREGNAEKIEKCRAYTQFGLGGDVRVFVTRNPDFRAYDWWCETQDPSYFADLNYSIIGNDDTAVMGYLPYKQYLGLVKEDAENTTVYFRTAEFQNDKVQFFTTPAIQGVGAISPFAFSNLGDEPVYLSRNGVYSIISNAVTLQNTPQNRSYWVDERLTKEPNLENAISVAHENKYYLSINAHTYIISVPRKDRKDYQTEEAYAAYYWEGFAPTCYLSDGKTLWFGDAEGRLCRFKNRGDQSDYFDGADESPVPIRYLFTTKQDDDAAGVYLKSLQKKGCYIVLKPHRKSTVNIYYNTNVGTVNEGRQTVKHADWFDFQNVDFERISFVSSTFAQPIPLRDKVKKYKTLQYVLFLEEVGETFSLVSIGKLYHITNKIARY